MMMVALAVPALWCLWQPAEVSAQNAPAHLDCPAAVRTLCTHAAPMPGKAQEQMHLPAESLPRTYLHKRHQSAGRVYSVDIASSGFELAGYNTTTGQLTLTTPVHFPLFDGSYALAAGDAPVLVFELSASDFERLEEAHGSGRVMLRLYFLLESLHDPQASFCEEDDDGLLKVKGRLMGARLWQAKHAGDGHHAMGDADVMASVEFPAGRDLGALVGLTMVSGQEPKSQVRGAPTLRAEVQPSSQRHFEQDKSLERFVSDATLLAQPCFVAALGQGGPLAAAMTVEVSLEGGRARRVSVRTDATGFPPLRTCVESVLARLPAPVETKADVRLTFYFESPR